MINHLNNLLRHLLMAKIDEITSAGQVRFEPPNEGWRSYISTLTQDSALNIYLFDIRENRSLRSNARMRRVDNGLVSEKPAPRRIDCHYLITVWRKTNTDTPTPQVEPVLEEQALLYKVTGVLMNSEPMVPRQVYEPTPLPAGFPMIIADEEIPTMILPVEGFPKLAEFWGTMGDKFPWKPAVYLIVTLPVVLELDVSAFIVTTRITEYRQMNELDKAEVWIQIGGRVLDSTQPLPDGSPRPVPGAWVALEEVTAGQRKQLQTITTDDRNESIGRYTFCNLRSGRYRLRVRATGLGEKIRDIDVPSPTGEYDLRFG